MAVKKFALSVPEDVMKEVDRAAKRFGVTRSRFIAGVLRSVSDARKNEEITRRIDRVFAEPRIASEQARTAAMFQAATSPIGTEW